MAKKLKTIQQLGNEILEELKKRKGLPDILESYGSNTFAAGHQNHGTRRGHSLYSWC